MTDSIGMADWRFLHFKMMNTTHTGQQNTPLMINSQTIFWTRTIKTRQGVAPRSEMRNCTIISSTRVSKGLWSTMVVWRRREPIRTSWKLITRTYMRYWQKFGNAKTTMLQFVRYVRSFIQHPWGFELRFPNPKNNHQSDFSKFLWYLNSILGQAKSEVHIHAKLQISVY